MRVPAPTSAGNQAAAPAASYAFVVTITQSTGEAWSGSVRTGAVTVTGPSTSATVSPAVARRAQSTSDARPALVRRPASTPPTAPGPTIATVVMGFLAAEASTCEERDGR